ncbi:MAG: flavin reductase [Lachnospiraceae bacterium]|nr:flavin reductase [Lachnospiraceae bacterium]
MDKKTINKLTYGLFVLTANEGDKDNGCITNTGIQVTTDPNRICFAVNKANYTHDMVARTRKFTLSIISQEADFELFKHFGFQSGRDVDKFSDFKYCTHGSNGIYYITKGTNGYISGQIEQIIDMGSHSLFIASVTDMEMLSEAISMDYGYYHANVKPKPEAVGTAPDGQTIWRCTICGYEYIGEDLPDDFICPLCKHPASDFEKVVKS